MPSKGTFGLDVLRDALQRRVQDTSIRHVAEEVGMSPSGLHVFLNGSNPHPKTREKLVSWYSERRRVETLGVEDVSAVDVDAAIRLLVHYIRHDSREQARERRMRDVIQRIEGASRTT